MQDGAYMVVGRYSGVSGTILGNMTGRYADNVSPLRGPNYKPKVSQRVSHDFFKELFKKPISKEQLLKEASETGLAEHNRVRALHKNTPPMVQGLAQTISAQAYAEKLVNEWTGSLLYSANNDRPGQGELLAHNWEPTPTAACKKATNQWYDEIKDYDYAKPGSATNTGNFTQVSY